MTRKTAFFEGWSRFKFNDLGVALGTNLTFYTSVAKRLKLKVRKFWGLILTFAEVTEEKLVEGAFCPPPFWIGLTFLISLSGVSFLICNFIKKEFRMNLAKFLRTPFNTEQLWRLLLKTCCRRKVAAVKSEKLKVFIVKYYDISKIFLLTEQSKCSVQLTCLTLSHQLSINSKHSKLSFEIK